VFEHVFEHQGKLQPTDDRPMRSGRMIEQRSGLVIQPTIGRDDAATVCGLLHGISRAAGAPDDIRVAATYWASAVDPEMERGDLQTVAWLLRDASASRRLPAAIRDQSRYWAAYLEGRLFR
jgi:hypothetical protein